MKKSICIVVPCFNEQENIKTLYNLVNKSLKNTNYDLSFIFVDDGSVDKTWEEIKKLSKKNNRVKGIKFSRNFGHQNALIAGIKNSNSDAVIIMDADMQHPPKLIPKFIKYWEKGFFVVNGVRNKTEREPILKKNLSHLYYKIANFFLDYKITPQGSDFKLIDKKVVDYLKTLQEHSLFIRGLTKWAGFEQVDIYFTAPNRKKGTPSYTFKKSFNLAKTGILSLSVKPLSAIILVGLFLTAVSFLAMFYGILKSINAGGLYFSPAVWLLFMNIFLIGLVLICLGIVAVYISFVYQEVIRRPVYLVSSQTNLKKVL